MSEEYLTEDEFVDFLCTVIEHVGGVAEFCQRTNVDRSMVYRVLRGEVPPQPNLLRHMTGIEETRTYKLPPHWVKWREAPHSLR